jgi:tetratricopeptide (TPR) repeat protein
MGAINNMGLIYGQLKDRAHAEDAYRRAVGIDSNSAIALFNLYETLVWEGKLDQADSLVSIAIRRFPAHDNIPYARWSLAYARGDEATMRRVVQAVRDSAGADRGKLAFASVMLAELDLLHGKLHEGERFIEDATQDVQSYGSKRRVLQQKLWLGGIDVWYRGDRVGGLRKMDAALARFPLSQMDTLDRPYLDLAYSYAMAGRPERARAYLAEYETIDPSLRAAEEGYRMSVQGVVTLSEGHAEAAIHEIEAGIALDPCLYCALADLGRAFTAAGQPDSAIAAYERYLTLHSPDKIDNDNAELPVMYRQLGELYEKKGDRSKALDYYGRFVELWRDADPDLQPQVAEIRQRMAGLASEERR